MIKLFFNKIYNFYQKQYLKYLYKNFGISIDFDKIETNDNKKYNMPEKWMYDINENYTFSYYQKLDEINFD